MYYIYMLRCDDNSLYTGMTSDIKRRFCEHKEQLGKGAKYTRSHNPQMIAALWQTESKKDACRLEYRIKTLKKSDKEDIISGEKALCDCFVNLDVDLYKRIAEPLIELL